MTEEAGAPQHPSRGFHGKQRKSHHTAARWGVDLQGDLRSHRLRFPIAGANGQLIAHNFVFS